MGFLLSLGCYGGSYFPDFLFFLVFGVWMSSTSHINSTTCVYFIIYLLFAGFGFPLSLGTSFHLDFQGERYR